MLEAIKLRRLSSRQCSCKKHIYTLHRKKLVSKTFLVQDRQYTSFCRAIYVILRKNIVSDTHRFGIPVESFSANNLSKKKTLRAQNADVKGQYFTTNVNSLNVVAIANTLTKTRQYEVKCVWSKCLGAQKENRKLIFM